jgi:hypothetical protein
MASATGQDWGATTAELAVGWGHKVRQIQRDVRALRACTPADAERRSHHAKLNAKEGELATWRRRLKTAKEGFVPCSKDDVEDSAYMTEYNRLVGQAYADRRARYD